MKRISFLTLLTAFFIIFFAELVYADTNIIGINKTQYDSSTIYYAKITAIAIAVIASLLIIIPFTIKMIKKWDKYVSEAVRDKAPGSESDTENHELNGSKNDFDNSKRKQFYTFYIMLLVGSLLLSLIFGKVIFIVSAILFIPIMCIIINYICMLLSMLIFTLFKIENLITRKRVYYCIIICFVGNIILNIIV